MKHKVSKKRVMSVISSCKTRLQLRSAINYALLAKMRREPIIDELIEFKILTLKY